MLRLFQISAFLCVLSIQGICQDVRLVCAGIVLEGEFSQINDSVLEIRIYLTNNSSDAVYIPQRNKGYFFGESCFVNVGSILAKPIGINNGGVIELKRLEKGGKDSFILHVNSVSINKIKSINVGIDFINEEHLPKKAKKNKKTLVSILARDYYSDYLYSISSYHCNTP